MISLDRTICDPELVQEFDDAASRLAPDFPLLNIAGLHWPCGKPTV